MSVAGFEKPNASARTKRERAAAVHDGLCIVQMPELSTCRCNCTKCWNKWNGESVCTEVRPKRTGTRPERS